MSSRGALAWIVCLCALAWATRSHAGPPPHAFRPVRQVAEEAQVRLDAAGLASVTHRSTWRIVHGPVAWLDVVHLDAPVALDPDAKITTDDGRELPARAAAIDGTCVRVNPAEPKALQQGAFTVELRWQVDLVTARELLFDGTSLRMTLAMPAAEDGLDSLRTVFDLPGAPEPPEQIVGDPGSAADAAVTSVRREAGRDILELIRPYAAAHDAITWTVRLDPRAVPAVVGSPLASSSLRAAPPAPGRSSSGPMAAAVLVLGALSAGFGMLVAKAAGASTVATTPSDLLLRPLIPLPSRFVAALAAGCLFAGTTAQFAGRTLVGSLLVGIACVCAAARWSVGRPAARGPGRWIEIGAEQAFGSAPRGPWGLLGVCGAALRYALYAGVMVSLAIAAGQVVAQGRWLATMDCAVLVPLAATGRARGARSPLAARGGDRWLSGVYRRLSALGSQRTAVCGRQLADGSVDEVRVQVLPRDALPGLLGIEIGRAWSTTPVGWNASPEVLVRLLQGSEADAKLRKLAPEAGGILGRCAQERVVRLLPDSPTSGTTAALARQLAEALTRVVEVGSPNKLSSAVDARSPNMG
jgi:hypothetical protein